jgi:ABC-2 type transport system ATP-binding protein
MIEARSLTKRYGDTLAVDNLSFTVEPGKITGFLGPNGAGKPTTMRLILGLDRPSGGNVTVNGRPFREQAFMDLTAASVDFRAGLPGDPAQADPRPADRERACAGKVA